MDELERFLDLERRLLERVSTRVEPFELGVAYLDEDCPERYYSNFLRIDAVPEGVTADHLAEAADRILGRAGLTHRLILVNDERGAARVALGLAGLGYATSWNVAMHHRRAPDRAPTVPVEQVPFADARPLIRETYVRDADIPDRLADPFTEQHGLKERAFGARFFVGSVGGEPAGSCELYVDGTDAQVENVGTLEEFRGRGVASSVVLEAVESARAAGAAHVFIVADEDDWPKELYARLGFDRVGRLAGCLRTPAVAG